MAYKRFVTRDGNRNHFMWDNAWTDEQIKAYYRYPSTLTAAYKSAPFRLTVCTAHYPITDADRLRREKAKMNTRELWREVVGQLAKLQTAHSDMEPAFLQEELGMNLRQSYRRSRFSVQNGWKNWGTAAVRSKRP